MRSSDTKKRVGSVGVTAILLVGVGVSYAFWTQGGAGVGSADTATTEAITVVQTSTVQGLGPGVAPAQLAGTFTNPGDTEVRVTTLDATLGKVTKGGAPVVGCDATDYQLAGFPVTVTQDLATGTGVGSWTGGTIEFENKTDKNQDACKGASVEITYTVS